MNEEHEKPSTEQMLVEEQRALLKMAEQELTHLRRSIGLLRAKQDTFDKMFTLMTMSAHRGYEKELSKCNMSVEEQIKRFLSK